MMKNSINYISVKDSEKIIQKARNHIGTHLVELQGNEIQSWKDYIRRIEVDFEFPTQCADIWARYMDWIRDLSWLGKEAYVLVIHDYTSFLRKDLKLKKGIIESFTDYILPWWQEDVVNCVVGGRAKPFNVYLVD